MKLSVVMPCYNAVSTLGGQLEALAQQQWSQPWELLIVDNGSTDGSQHLARRYAPAIPHFRVIDASARRGQAFARNVGVQAAVGDAVAFCDADDEVAPGWVEAMGNALAHHGFVACREDTTKLNPPWLTATRRNAQWDGPQIVDFLPAYLHAGGGTLGVQRSLYTLVGGFDEALLCREDTDFCVKLQLAGVPLHFVPEAVIYIRYRSTLRETYHQSRRWALYGVKVHQKYRGVAGAKPLPSGKDYARSWPRLLWQALCMRHNTDCFRFAWRLGWQVGVLQGCFTKRHTSRGQWQGAGAIPAAERAHSSH